MPLIFQNKNIELLCKLDLCNIHSMQQNIYICSDSNRKNEYRKLKSKFNKKTDSGLKRINQWNMCCINILLN